MPYQDKTNIGRWKSATKIKETEVMYGLFHTLPFRESRYHPAVFPGNLPYLCIKMHGIKPDMLVYDPFMGIGTTALACIKLGVNYMGTEIDADYIKVALEDIEKRKKEMATD